MKKIIIITSILILVSGCKADNIDNERSKKEYEVLATMQEKVNGNSVYCSTMQLAWNEIYEDEKIKKVEFIDKNELIKKLNKKEFKKDMLSEEDYIATVISPTKKDLDNLKSKIFEKFKEKSDILDLFEATENKKDFLFYSMMVKEFKFETEFKDLGEIKNKKYFGFDRNEENDKILDQVKVLFYKNKNNFAIKVRTSSNDELYFYKNDKIDNFGDEYKDMVNESKAYNGNRAMSKNDLVKILYMDFDKTKYYKKLKNIELNLNNKPYKILEVIQTIKFKLNNRGGKLKSEAGILMKYDSIMVKKIARRDFICDEKFTMFLKEIDKEKPYFALRVENNL